MYIYSGKKRKELTRTCNANVPLNVCYIRVDPALAPAPRPDTPPSPVVCGEPARHIVAALLMGPPSPLPPLLIAAADDDAGRPFH